MRQPDNPPAFCRVHRNGRSLIGMGALTAVQNGGYRVNHPQAL